LNDDLGEIFKFFASAGYPTPEKPAGSGSNIQIGTKAVVEVMLDRASQGYDLFNGETPEAVVQHALESTAEKLTEEYGPDMNNWRLPNAPIVFHPNNFLSIPQANQNEGKILPLEMNRGTENNMTVFTAEGIVAYEVTPPGQSGFISPEGIKSEHYDDQLQMYADFGRKRMWIYAEDVDKNVEAVTVLEY
jgi:penicillin amidase